MRNLNRNMRGFYYSLLDSTDTLTDSAGYDTGEPVSVYANPVYAKGNISPSRGEAIQEQFGIDLEYDKVIQLQGIDWPIDENTVLWVDKTPPASFEGTWDYVVVRVAVSLNQTSLAVKRVRNA